MNSPIVGGATIEAPAAPAPAVVRGRSAARPAFWTEEILCWLGWCRSKGGCDDWGCGMNSPIVDGATIEAPAAPAPAVVRGRSAASPAFWADEILCWLGWCRSKGGCDDWGCGANSPVVDGAVVENQGARAAATSDRSFHELHMGGMPNAAGFACTRRAQGQHSVCRRGRGRGDRRATTDRRRAAARGLFARRSRVRPPRRLRSSLHASDCGDGYDAVLGAPAGIGSHGTP